MPWLWSLVRGRAKRFFRSYRRHLSPPLGMQTLEDRLAPASTPGFLLGISTGVADFTGDRVPDLVIGRPDGTVKALNGADGSTLREFAPFGGFKGPITVAVADGDLVLGAGFGGGARVQVYDGLLGNPVRDFLAFEAEFRGGVSVGAGDVTGDGVADIAVGAGFSGGPRVRVFDGLTGKVVRDLFVYEPEFRGGVSVGVGDSNGDGFADLIVGAGPRGGPRVRVISGADSRGLRDYFVGDVNARNGVAVGVSDLDGNGLADVSTLSGGVLRVFAGTNPNPFQEVASAALLLGSGDLDGDGFSEILAADAVNVAAFGGAVLAATGLTITPTTKTGFANTAPVAPASLFSNRAIVVGGAAGSTATVQFNRLRAYTSNNDEIGLFPVDDATGRIGTLLPGAAGYLDAALAAGRRVPAIASLTGAATGTVSVPGASFYGLYLTSGSHRSTSFEAAQFRVLPGNRFAATDVPNGGFQDYHAVVGSISVNDGTVPPPPPPPGGNFDDNLTGFTKTTTPGTGTTIAKNGSVTLTEGTSFRVGLSTPITIPSTPTLVKVTFDAPVFDTASENRIRDAFEIAVLAADGTPLALATAPERDASFNWSEGFAPLTAAGTTNDTLSATINLSALPAGMPAQLVLRLVNDDGDDTTRVTIHRIDYLAAATPAPTGTAAEQKRQTSIVQDLGVLNDVTPSIVANYGRTTLTEDRTILTTDVSLKNVGSYPVNGSVIVAVGNVSDADVGVLNPDGFTADGRPYFDFTPEIGTALTPGDKSAARTIRFTNPNRTRFSYDLAVLAGLNDAPTFTSSPVTLVEAGKAYSYAAKAIDPENQALTYSLLGGPAGLAIDAKSGVVTWPTASADLGTAAVRLQATDPLGASAEQAFSITIRSEVPNRPPVFTSTPPTDATVAAPFEVQTFATGSQPVGVAVVGTKFVTANSGDARLGIVGGDALSIGEPHPANFKTSFVTPLTVDLGFRSNTYEGRDRDLNISLAADVNDDGNPDLIASVSTGTLDYYSPSHVGFLAVRLGNGDGTFRPGWQTALPAVADRTSVATGLRYLDVTSDGIRDLVTTQYRGRNVLVYKGLAGGTFADTPIVSVYGGAGSMQVADLNGDGKTDVVLFENNPNGQFRTGLSTLFGNGDGTFGPETHYPGADDNANSGYLADVNGDNRPDTIRTYGNYQNRVEVRLNDGLGGFGPAIASGTYFLYPDGNKQYDDTTSAYIADFDGDSKVDLALVSNFRGLWFLRGTGDGHFGDNTLSGNRLIFDHNLVNLGSAVLGVDGTPTDLNADGKPDLLIGNYSTSQLLVALGTGGSNFTGQLYNSQFTDDIGPGYRGSHSSYQLSVADFNRDGVQDVLVGATANGSRPGGAAVVLGDQPGTLRAPRALPYIYAFGENAVAADFTGDGIPDIASFDQGGSNIISVAAGRGDGSFDAFQQAVGPRFFGDQAAAGATSFIADDFDRDGKMDIAWINTANFVNSGGYYQAFGLGNGTFQIMPDVTGALSPHIPGRGGSEQELVSGDFNGDGHPDLAMRVTDAQGPGDIDGGTFTRVDVLLYNPTAKRFNLLTDAKNLLGPLNVRPTYYVDEAVGFADLDGDGQGELFAHAVAVRGYTDRPDTPERLYVWKPTLNLAATDATQLFTLTVIDNPQLSSGEFNPIQGFVVADFNGDGKPDLANSAGTTTNVSFGNGDLTFRDRTVYLTNNLNISGGDVNGDGHIDLIPRFAYFGNFSLRPLTTILLGRADGTFSDPQGINTVFGSAAHLAVGDFNLDGRADFVTHSNRPFAEVYLAAPPGLAAVQKGDINGDGKLDLVGITTGFNRVKILLGNGDETFSRQTDLFVGASPVDLKLVDVTGDGRLDIVTANRVGKSVTVLAKTDTGYARTDIALETRPSKLAVHDLSGDGRPDIVAISDTGEDLSVIVNSAAGFGTPTPSFLGFAPGSVAMSDLTGDGATDVLLSDPIGKRLFILPGLGNGAFAAAMTIPLQAAPDEVAIGDLNFDGRLDVIVTLPDGDRVGVLFNRGAGRFTTPQTIQVGDAPNSLAIQDVNGDSKLDILATNGDDTLSVILNRYDPNSVYRYTPTATDPDGDAVTFDLDTAPGGMLYDAASGQVLWAPMPDQIGGNEVVLRADDGRGGSATQGFTITVIAPTTTPAPVFTSQPLTAIPADGTFSYQPTTTNPADSPLRYRLLNGPAGLTVDPTTGAVSWDPRHPGLSLGIFRTDTQTPRWVNRGNIQSLDSPSLRSATVSAEGWFKFDSVEGANGLFRKSIFNGFNGQTTSWSLDNSNGSLHLRVGNIGTYFDAYAPTSLPTGQWLHLAFSFDGGTNAFVLFVNASPVLSGVSTLPISYDEQPLIVGQNLLGSVTDVRVWNVVRTAAELQAGMHAEVPSDSPGLVLDYDFTGGPAAATVLDQSPFLNHGSISTTYEPYNYPPHIPVLSFTGTHPVTLQVEDGKGGIATQTFNINIVPTQRGSVSGMVLGPTADGWTIFVDANRNSYRDAGEAFAVSDPGGGYTIPNLLAVATPLAIEPRAGFNSPATRDVAVSAGAATIADFAITAAAPGTIRGKVTIDGTAKAIAGFAVYSDANGNRVRDDGEAFSVTDRLGDYALAGLAAGSYVVRVDAPAGWNAATPASGSYSIPLAADATSAGNDFAIAASVEAASTPVFVSLPPAPAMARSLYRYAAVAVDPLARPITYELVAGPAGMVVDRTNGVVVWTPTARDVGDARAILKAVNDTGRVAMQDFTITVAAANTAPIITSSSTATAIANESFRFDVQAQDAEQSALSFALEASPAGLIIDAAGRIQGTPTAPGAQTATVIVRDGVGGETRQTLSINILASGVNAPPVIVAGPRATALVGQPFVGRVTADDPNDDVLTFSLVSGPAGLTVDAIGLVNWTPTEIGTAALRVRVEDGRGGFDERDFTITAASMVTNQDPQLAPAAAAFAVAERVFARTLSATDSDGDAVAFQLVSGPFGLSLESTRGTVRWLPQRDQLGVHAVTVRAVDPLGGFDEETFTITVRGSGGPPAITSTPPTSTAVGLTYIYAVTATDADADPLTYALSNAPSGMTIDAVTGVISWSPLVGQVGSQPVIVRVSDGAGGFTTQAFSIAVAAGVPNDPPVITTTPSLDAVVGTAFVYTLQASDPDGGAVTYAVRSGPAGLSINAGSGVITWTPTAADLGDQVIVLTATDPGGAAAVQSFLVRVAAANAAPDIVSLAPASVPQGGLFRYDIVANDPDREPLTYELINGPAGLTLDPLGRVRWQTALDTPLGERSATFTVRDARGGSDTQSITFNVVLDMTPPRVAILVTNGLLYPWSTEPARVRVSATDDVGVTSITLTVDGKPVMLDAAASTSVFFSGPGGGKLRAFASDAAGNQGKGAGQISMRSGTEDGSGNDLGSPPFTVSISNISNGDEVQGFVEVRGSAGSDEFTEYVLSYRRAEDNIFKTITRSTTAVNNGILGKWDTTLLQNEQYVLKLEVFDTFGGFGSTEREVGVTGDFKLGNFRLSFADITVPVAGIPITLARTYDSLTADRDGELGFGWSVEFRNTNLRTGLARTGLEDLGIYAAFKPGTKVYVTLPGGRREGYTFTPDIRALPGLGNSLVIATPRFTPDSGVRNTLSVQSRTLIVNEFGELFSGSQPYNPAAEEFGGGYTVTTPDGLRYRIDGNSGLLTSATDRNNNTLTFTNSGISGGGVSLTFERDARGRITKAIDPAGNSVKYAYDARGNLASVTDREGNITRFEYLLSPAHYLDKVVDPLGRTGVRVSYGSDGRLSQSMAADGTTTGISYDTDQDLVLTTDPLGNITISRYDDRGNVVQTVDALGGVSSTTYNADNHVLSSTDPLGRTTSRTYDSAGNPASRTDALGATIRTTYDAGGRLLTTTDARGLTTIQSRDSKGNLTGVTNPLGDSGTIVNGSGGQPTKVSTPGGTSINYTYTPTGNLASLVDAQGTIRTSSYDALGNRILELTTYSTVSGLQTRQVSSKYDAEGRLIAFTDAGGTTSRTEYDAAGNTTAEIDGLGRRTVFEYDVLNRLVRSVAPDGTEIRTEYDAAGRPVRVIDRAGRETRIVYDALGREVMRLLPDATPLDGTDNPTLRNEYDAASQLVARIDELGRRTTIAYDAAGRDTAVTDALGNVTRKVYDAGGQLLSTIDALNHVTTSTYDVMGRVVAILLPDGSTASTIFGIGGEVLSRTNALGNTTHFEYGAASTLTAVVDPLGARTTYINDSLGRLIGITDANGHTTAFEYDVLDRQTARILPDGSRTTTAYDAIGRILSTTDYRGLVTQYTYDSEDRLILETAPDGSTVAYTYTPAGNRATATDSRGMTRYQYDERDRLIQKTEPDNSSIAYTYDAVGNRLTVASAAGTTGYSYDALNRLIRVTAPDGAVTMYAYSAVGQLVRTDGADGTTEIRTHDANGRVTSIITTSAAGVIGQFAYTLDLAGQVIASDELGGRHSASAYDAGGRLIQETSTDPSVGNRAISYTYDAVGNRITRADSVSGTTVSEFDSRDRLLRETTGLAVVNFSYDANGNLLLREAGAADRTEYHWDSHHRLVAAMVTTATGTQSEQNVYDADGIRVARIADGVETRFIVDTNRSFAQVLGEYRPDGTLLTSDVVGLRRISRTQGGVTSFFHADRLGSIRFLTTATAAVSDRYVFDAFGRLLAHTGASGNPFLFNGEQRSALTGLDYLRARHYDPAGGRFLATDPDPGAVQSPVSLHRYSYGANNPLLYTDPSGKSLTLEVLFYSAIAGGLAAALTFSGVYVRDLASGASYEQAIKDAALAGFAAGAITFLSAGVALTIAEGAVVSAPVYYFAQFGLGTAGATAVGGSIIGILDGFANLGRNLKYFITGEKDYGAQNNLTPLGRAGFSVLEIVYSLVGLAGAVPARRFALEQSRLLTVRPPAPRQTRPTGGTTQQTPQVEKGVGTQAKNVIDDINPLLDANRGGARDRPRSNPFSDPRLPGTYPPGT